jgi:hypothetical protein
MYIKLVTFCLLEVWHDFPGIRLKIHLKCLYDYFVTLGQYIVSFGQGENVGGGGGVYSQLTKSVSQSAVDLGTEPRQGLTTRCLLSLNFAL